MAWQRYFFSVLTLAELNVQKSFVINLQLLFASGFRNLFLYISVFIDLRYTYIFRLLLFRDRKIYGHLRYYIYNILYTNNLL